MTMFDELIDLLDLVGSRDCIHLGVYVYAGCSDEACEPCTARKLYARMVEARDRVSPQDDAVRTARSARKEIDDAIAEIAEMYSRGAR